MKKFFKYVLFFCLVIVLNFSYVYAVGIDMNITNSANTVNEITNNTIDEVSTNRISNSTNAQNTSSTQKISTTNTSDEDFHLTVSDIINIILIAVGIVIIFLAIAILIKIK